MAWLGSSDAVVDTRGGLASSSTDEHSGTMNVSRPSDMWRVSIIASTFIKWMRSSMRL